MSAFLFTSESVSEGHPDKMADQVSDGVLDALLEQDAEVRAAVEVLLKKSLAVVAGEVSGKAQIDVEEVVRRVCAGIGYNDANYGFDSEDCVIVNALTRQSPDIAMGVDADSGAGKAQGAGDQGMMFGYASDETEALMPAPIFYAHRLVHRQAQLRRSGEFPWLRPDAKSQVTFRYAAPGRPESVAAVVFSTQHAPDIGIEELREVVLEKIIRPVLPEHWLKDDTRYHINPTGKFVVGGPAGDCGLTGRKIIVDSYGGMARHGGGAFSGKDPSKVDRSAAYAARYVAKNIVATGLAKRCEVQLSYAIGVSEPISVVVDTFGSGEGDDREIATLVKRSFDLSPAGIIEMLQLKHPIYLPTASYGHFGRSEESFRWEQLDRVADLRKAA